MYIALAVVVTVLVLVALRLVAGKAKAISFTMPTYNGTFYGFIGGWYLPFIVVAAWYEAGVRSVGWLTAVYLCVMVVGWFLGPTPSSQRNT